MGGERFDTYRKGINLDAVFTAAKEQALYDHGHSGYSGTIAEKPGVQLRNSGSRLTLKEAQAFADEDSNENEKWGDAFAVEVYAEDRTTLEGFILYGWASS